MNQDNSHDDIEKALIEKIARLKKEVEESEKECKAAKDRLAAREKEVEYARKRLEESRKA